MAQFWLSVAYKVFRCVSMNRELGLGLNNMTLAYEIINTMWFRLPKCNGCV
jgi:hypothetical protein